MRKLLLVCFSMSMVCTLSAQNLAYYLPDSVSYNSSIPKPKEIIHHEVGEWHITHDRLVNYMKAIAAASPNRVKMEVIGYSYESRPQVIMIFSSKKNLDNLEAIRKEHVLLTDASKSNTVDVNKMPIVVYIGHSIHGNEPSGSNAALLTAYYLAAAEGKQIDDLLDNTIILFDPSFNPDGLQRFSTWANQHKSKNLVTDPNSREFNEVWPGGRFNHYWFDLNRDWLPAVHIESQNRLRWFHAWKPNILTDHHEQGSNASFFFQPGVPSRVNPLTPEKNQELTAKLGKYHARNLDRIGSLYFTKENYDDFYYGKGSTFPDINGGIGILFEQASSRGHAQQTSNGILRFPATIKNQFVTALSTLEGAYHLRKEFLEYQRDFFKKADNNNALNAIKGYVFGDKKDKAKTAVFIEMLLRHQIDVHHLRQNTGDFEKGSAFFVPTNQAQSGLIKTIFEKQLSYQDSLFYDITSWTMPLAFGLPYAEQLTTEIAGEKLRENIPLIGKVEGIKSDYAYVFEWNELYAPKALYALQEAGVLTKVATNTGEFALSNGTKKFNYGSILIPVHLQQMNSNYLYTLIQNIAQQNGIVVYALNSGNAIMGSDLGSSKFISLNKPTIAMIVGNGVNATDAGEIWHLLDQRM
ncbi:MAG: M14 metallopeptidase family protein, partial [Chitinophagaceae bacterium]